jgi:excisionase family DNA binding protein
LRRKLLLVRTSAERLGIQEKTLRFWIWQRKIEFVKIGRSVRIPEDVIDRMIEDGTVPVKK